MRTLWRVFHSSEALQKSNIVPTLRQQFAQDATLHLLARPNLTEAE
jgi:hypothetical protein